MRKSIKSRVNRTRAHTELAWKTANRNQQTAGGHIPGSPDQSFDPAAKLAAVRSAAARKRKRNNATQGLSGAERRREE